MSTSQRGPVSGEATRPVPQRGRVQPLPAPRAVRRRATVRKVDPWSVLKLSLIFYFCLLLVVMLGLTVVWAVVIRLGLIEALQELLGKVGLELVRINGANIARIVFLIGLLNVVLWSGINVFMTFLYNLIADLVGGLKVTLAEDDTGG
ncbi:MAG: DUF3566 domain-containing protein [Euzebyales bacterium]|nr:DUF3566 domain-containing protein [Euzebyales bacterium]MBA3622310.1 DUF3566 domain-containing protein [Euzebyales bacterium]